MKKLLLAMPLAFAAATPARATGGLVCKTAGADPLELSVGFGHVPGSPIILTRLMDKGRNVPVKDAQWWLDNQEVRLVLIAPDAMREEARIRALRNGHVYDGSIWRSGRQRWVRCREG